MPWTPKDLPDLSGSTAVVTGANSGIGFHTARELAEHGAGVVLACRNIEAAAGAAKRMPGSVRIERLDLSSQASVAAFADRWKGPLDLLVNNAGVMTPPRYRETEDGHELMFGTNHLGHFALTARLLPALLESPSPRVVTVASVAHHAGNERVLEANPEAGYRPQAYYGNSKLANLLFALELHRRTTSAGSSLVSTAAHPGISATNLVASRDGLGANPLVHLTAPYFMPLLFQSAARGADATLYAATAAQPGSYTGPTRRREWRGPVGPARLSRHARDEDLARALWELSEQKTGLALAL
ncbi:oxidoreductase [Nocardioides terrisoli]|uniref:oxidoreductase n=1 Tax=Nocardioides terrisoli TaxID=3388267 RepID=UPI00287BBC1C|nr:oxidoreductase [Nocardioides marmorisolisilvae]